MFRTSGLAQIKVVGNHRKTNAKNVVNETIVVVQWARNGLKEECDKEEKSDVGTMTFSTCCFVGRESANSKKMT